MSKTFVRVLFLVTIAAAAIGPRCFSAEPITKLHFRPATGVLGDTIPYYWKGVYHVFYLKGQRWGHIVTKDLVHWRELPDALDKGESETAPDGENCWTGSIVERENVFHLFYTGKNSRDPLGDQKVMQATSTDLLHWTKQPQWTFYADGAVYWSKPVNGAIDDKLIYHHQAFRDPEVFWNAGEKRWWLLLHAALADGASPAFARYTSDNLDRWQVGPPLLVFSRNYSGDCPNIFEMGARWYIIAADRHYTWADRVEGPYQADMLPYDCGELFVPKTLFDGKRRLMAGWLADREGHTDSGKGAWGGTMSMLREVYADAQGRLCLRPPREIVKAYRSRVSGMPGGLSPGESVAVPDSGMMTFRIEPSTADAEATVVFRAQANDAEAGYRLKVSFTGREISLGDRYRTYARVCDFDPKRPVEVRVFLEDTVIECFVNDAYAFAMHAYDHSSGALRFESEKGKSLLSGLSVSRLRK